MASSTDMPATKRRETRRPMEERSEKARKGLLVDRPIKKERSKQEPLKGAATIIFAFGIDACVHIRRYSHNRPCPSWFWR